MKNLIILLASALILPHMSFAQWTTSGTTITGAVSTSGPLTVDIKPQAYGSAILSLSPNSGGIGIIKSNNIGLTAYPLTFQTNSLERMRIDGNGNLGIGTTSPGYRLHVKSPDIQLVLQTDGTGNNRGIVAFGNAAGVLKGSMGLFGADETIRIGDAMDYRLVIKQGGYIGIGTNSPTVKLHVGIDGSTNTNYSTYSTSDIGLALQNKNATNGNLNILSYSDASGWGVADVGVITNHSSHTAKFFLSTRPAGSGPTQRMLIDENGNVGIGTSTPNQKLTVNGTIYGKEVKVDLNVPGPDYVFADNYQLPTINELKAYIDQHKHLPEVPSAKEMEANGINLGEMNMMLLKTY